MNIYNITACMHIKALSKYNNINVSVVTWAVVYSLFMSARTASDPACQIYISGVYILHKIHFFPAAKILFFPLLVISSNEVEKYFQNYLIYSYYPPSQIFFSFFSPRRGENGKDVSSSLHFYILFPPTTYFIFFEKKYQIYFYLYWYMKEGIHPVVI